MTDLAGLRTLSMFEARAQAILPADAFAFGAGGSASEATLERNRHALRHLAIEQRVLMNVKTIDTRASFLDMTLPSPIIVAPMGGMYRFHPEGDVEMARGATRDGGMAVVSGVAGWPLHDIAAAANGPLIFQLYWLGDREWVADKLGQARAAGFKAVCLTVDTAAYSRRERDMVLDAPGQRRGGPAPAPPLGDTQSGLTWDDVDWARSQVTLPFGLKGILTARDARIALDHDIDFIWVSNHGGRQLDDGRASIDALTDIVDVVQGRVPLIVDGGFRRGTDVMKGLALGATLVAFGRTVLWGLAVAGADGVQRVLRLLNEELTINMKLAGRTRTSGLTPDLVQRVDGSGFAVPVVRPMTRLDDPEASLMAQLSPSQRAAVRAITDSTELSEVDKMWGITETLFGVTGSGGEGQ